MSGNTDKLATAAIRDRLAAFQARESMTLKQLGARVGRSESYISRYLSGSPVGDVEKFERAVRDRLDSEERRRTWGEIYFETEAIRTCFMVFDLIRESSDIGLVTSPAGIGKTTACRRYAAEHSTVLFFSGEEGNGSSWGVMKALCGGLDMRKFDGRQQRRSEFLRDKLAGSQRLIIVDNAQRLNMSGLRWLFDFHDATGVSVALVGNPEVLTRLTGNDQMTSRIGFKQDVTRMSASKDWIDQAADAMVEAMWPDAAGEIRLLARESARKAGVLRTLNKQLRIAIRLCETDAYAGKFGKAFVEARHLIGADSQGD
jgi:DNA transposition AAA+ family ATPase